MITFWFFVEIFSVWVYIWQIGVPWERSDGTANIRKQFLRSQFEEIHEISLFWLRKRSSVWNVLAHLAVFILVFWENQKINLSQICPSCWLYFISYCCWVIGSCPSVRRELAVYLRNCMCDKSSWQSVVVPWMEGGKAIRGLRGWGFLLVILEARCFCYHHVKGNGRFCFGIKGLKDCCQTLTQEGQISPGRGATEQYF